MKKQLHDQVRRALAPFAELKMLVSATHRPVPEVLDGAVEVRRLPHEGRRVAQVEAVQSADELGRGAAALRRIGRRVSDVLVHPCNAIVVSLPFW